MDCVIMVLETLHHRRKLKGKKNTGKRKSTNPCSDKGMKGLTKEVQNMSKSCHIAFVSTAFLSN